MSAFHLQLEGGGQGRPARISGFYTNRMKRRMVLSQAHLTFPNDFDPPTPSVIFEGDPREARDLLHAMAALAWADGWRPGGLVAAVGAFIQGFKPAPVDPNSPARR